MIISETTRLFVLKRVLHQEPRLEFALLHMTKIHNDRGRQLFLLFLYLISKMQGTQLKKHIDATLVSGNLREAVRLPPGEDLHEWLAVNSMYSLYWCGSMIY